MKTKYEKLQSLPTYGPMYIPITENGEGYYSEGLAVKFFKDSGEEWVANIRPGMTDYSWIFEFDDNIHLLVIAGGIAHIINPNIEKPISSFGGGFDFCQKEESGKFVLSDNIGLTIVETDTSHWNTDRISWDGIKVLLIKNGIVTGISYSPINDADEWIEFKYNINTKELIGGSYLDSYTKKKPWWKFW